MLRKEKWFLCLILNIITLGLFTFYIGKKLNVYDKNAWYSSPVVWIISFIGGIIPFIVLLFIFYNDIGTKVSIKLSVPLEKIYSYPYIWILSLIIPIFGWAIFILLVIYVHMWYTIYLKRGNGEIYS